MPISPLPTPAPNRGMSEEDFANAADDHVAALPTFVTEANALQVDVNNKQVAATAAQAAAELAEDNAVAAASVAQGSAQLAGNWATWTGSLVPLNTDYSAKEYAIGSFVPTGSAKDWASKESTPVSGANYSAKYYSVVAQTAAAAAQSAAGLPSLPGNANKVLAVNPTANGVTWTALVSLLPSLTSNAGKVLTVNPTNDNVTWANKTVIGECTTTAVTLATPTYLPCNGSVYLKTSYPTLSTLLGTLFSNTPWTNSTGGALGTTASGNMVRTTNGTLLMSCATSPKRSTNNGTTWTDFTLPNSSIYLVAGDGGKVVGVTGANGGTAAYSSDNGASWQNSPAIAQNCIPQDIAATPTFSYVIFVGPNGSNVAVNYVVYSTTYGAGWQSMSVPSSDKWRCIGYGNDTMLVVGEAGTVRANTTWVWTASSNIPLTNYTKARVAYGDGVWVVVSNANVSSYDNVAYSVDNGTTWVRGKLSDTLTDPSIIFEQGVGFIVGGALGKVFASTTGKAGWTTVYDGGITSYYGAIAATSSKLIACAPSSTSTNYTVRLLNPYGYDTATSFATPIATPSTNKGINTYIRGTD